MSLLLSGDLRLAKDYTRPDDADAVAYIAAVEAADGQALETATRMAINSFVKGCKADGIWPAIKASCILAGARTLAGALVPLVGAAPTNVGGLFVSGDYNRKTGLVGNGDGTGTGTKYLNSNRNNDADPRDNRHISAFTTSTPNQGLIGTNAAITGMSHIFENSGGTSFRSSSDISVTVGTPVAGLLGVTRSNSSGVVYRLNGASTSATLASVAPGTQAIAVFSRNTDRFSNSRLAFYSIGESLDLALLDARVTGLINAFGAAIP